MRESEGEPKEGKKKGRERGRWEGKERGKERERRERKGKEGNMEYKKKENRDEIERKRGKREREQEKGKEKKSYGFASKKLGKKIKAEIRGRGKGIKGHRTIYTPALWHKITNAQTLFRVNLALMARSTRIRY